MNKQDANVTIARAWLQTWLLCALFGVASFGCARQAQDKLQYIPPGQTELRVKVFAFQGVEQVDEQELRDGLATKTDPGFRAADKVQPIPFLGKEPSYFNYVEWERDLERIITFYKRKGFFNAKIVSQNLNQSQGTNTISISLRIKEGEPTRVVDLDFEGLPDDAPNGRKLLDGQPVIEGNIFTEDNYLRAKSTMEKKLRERSYAYARVRGRVLIDAKKNTARITFFVDAGPRAVFGGYKIEPSHLAGESYIEDAIAFEQGQEYSAEKLSKTQEALYDLGIYSLVTVQPDFDAQEIADTALLETPDDTQQGPGALGISDLLNQAQDDAAKRTQLPSEVPIIIRVKEAKVWSVRVGSGFSLSSTRQDIHGALNISNRNILGSLGKFDQFNTVGYAVTPGILSQLGQGEGLALDPSGFRGIFFESLFRFSKPQFIERRTTGFAQLNVERDIQINYIGIIPSASIGARRPLWSKRLNLELSANVLFTSYSKFTDDYLDELRKQGLDANDSTPSLFLEYFEQKLIYDGRDNPIDPRRGWRAQLSMQEAGQFVRGEYAYIKPSLEFDAYLSYTLRHPQVTAFRFSASSIYNKDAVDDAGNQRGIPLISKNYGGGRGSLRGMGSRYLGYFTDDEEDPGPIGANTMVEIGIEQRRRLMRNLLDLGELWGALYVDAGSFSDAQLYIDTAANSEGVTNIQDLGTTLIYGAGAGVYWLTPIGPLRVDVATNVTDLDNDERYTPAAVNLIRSTRGVLGFFSLYMGIGHSF